MRVIASVAVTADGYMDDASPSRLVISNDMDWDAVRRLRGECDAILIGAETLRRDNPALVIRDEALRRERLATGLDADIVKVVVSGSGNLPANARFFTEGPGARKIVITTGTWRGSAPDGVAEVVRLPQITARGIVDTLSVRGIRSLMVEGGAQILRMFIDEGAIDIFRLAVGPEKIAPAVRAQLEVSPDVVNHEVAGDGVRLPYFGALPFAGGTMNYNLGDIGVTYYIISPMSPRAADRFMLARAVELSRNSVPVPTAYRVGCVIETVSGAIFTGYTHETGPHNHAEEEAIAKALTAGADLAGATAYTSMEPCSQRASKPVSCSELIIAHRFARVVYGYAEPAHFVECQADTLLRAAGIDVIVIPDFDAQVREINGHILG